VPLVLDPWLVVLDLLGAEHPAHGFGVHFACPVPVRPMQLRRIAVAVTTLMSAAEAALQDGAGKHKAYLGNLLGNTSRLGALFRDQRHQAIFSSWIPHLRHSIQYAYIMRPSEVTAAINGFSPYTVDEDAACFARSVVRAAGPPNVARAKALLFATSRLAGFGEQVGLPLSPEVLLHPSVIERFCTLGMRATSPATPRTVRTNLRHVAARVLPRAAKAAPLPRERAKVPYSTSEIASYLQLADAQPTETRRHHGSALICLGAGAGLMGTDLRTVRGTDVVLRSGGVLVKVGGRRPRIVPVRAVFHERLIEAARFAGDAYLIGGKAPSRRNVTTPLVSSLAGGVDLPPIDLGRLRATWLTECARLLGLRAFMDAAGIVCSQRLGDIVSHIEPVGEAAAVRRLSGRHKW